MPISDTRLNVLQIVNEVKRKLGVPAVSTLTADSQATVLVDYLNDVIAYISDYGDWKEMLREILVTASTSVNEYAVDTSAPIKSIHEIAFTPDVAPLRLRTIDDLRRWDRTTGTGRPRNWAILNLDNVNTGNPLFRVYPTPGSAENNQTFDILYYKKPPLFTTADVSAIPQFPSRMVVQGVLAYALKDEARGTQNVDYLTEKQGFEEMVAETWNRYNGDSGSDTFVTPRIRGSIIG